MATVNRTCCICRTPYTYCYNCNEDKNKPMWMTVFHDDNCRKIYYTCSNYEVGHYGTKEEAKEKLETIINDKDLYYLTEEENKDFVIDCYKNLLDCQLFPIISSIKDFHREGDTIMEGSQGLLLDKDYGLKPNTTSAAAICFCCLSSV